MKVIVDTSVWSLALRRIFPSSHPQAEQLRKLIDSSKEVLLLGVVLTEVLQGTRQSREFDRLKKYLMSFPLLELSRDDYIFAAEIRNKCQGRGIQASLIDFLIAATASRREIFLLTADKDFERIASVVPLNLL